jgi:hypothetical protein
MFGKAMIKKVMLYILLGPLALLANGGFNIMDMFLIPMISGIFEPIVKPLMTQGGDNPLAGMFGGIGATS